MNVLKPDQISHNELWWLLEAVTDGIWMWDVRSDEVYWSPTLLRLLGLEAVADLESDVVSLIHPEDRARHTEALTTAIETGKRYEVELRIRNHSGDYLWFRSLGRAVVDSKGCGPCCVEGFLVDVTKAKKQREALRRSKDLFQSFMDLCPAAVFIKDEAGRHLYVNPTTADLVGKPPAEIIDKTHFEIFPEATAEQLDKVDKEVLAKGEQRNWIGRIDRQDGLHHWVHDVKFPVLLEDDRLAVGGFGLDITELRAAQETANSVERLESIGRLAGGVAHDFNNMLSVILISAATASREPGVSASLRAMLAEIVEAGQQASLVTNQLLAFARKQATAPVNVHLDDRVDRTMSMLERLIGEDVQIVRRKSEAVWPVHLDPGQLEQVLANICTNARDAISGYGTITVETRNQTLAEDRQGSHEVIPGGSYVLLSVSDSGCGMSEETLRYLFEPFYTTKEMGSGTGLGMSSVFGMVKQNRGFIDVASQLGVGTVITIYLPRTARIEEPPGETCEAQPLSRGAGEKILLVEDNDKVLRTTSKALQGLGYRVIEASRPSGALETVRRDGASIDLVISDIIMPEMNGVELAGKILQQRPRMKFMLWSGYSAGTLSERGVKTKNLRFLGKPLSLEGLADEVRTILDQSSNPLIDD